VNGPRRLVDDHTVDPELARLVRVAQPPRALDPGAMERSRKHVVALGSVPAALGVLVWVKHAALGAVLGVTVMAAASAPRLLAEREATVSPSASVVPRERTRAPVRRAAPAPVEPVESVEPVAVPEPETLQVAPSAPAAAADAGLSREIALLESARSELERRPGSALALLAQHEREFPSAALALEREFLTVTALVRFGRRPEAEKRAEALRARSPGSLYERRLKTILGTPAEAR
jgi:hypothetical protein